MESDIETKILEKLSKSKLITKQELIRFLQTDGSRITKPEINSAVRNLLNMGYINQINPVGSSCLVITQEGSKAIQSR
ncbi:MAG: hypothetical protein B6U68_03555 [Candidatus Aenigmarchaeota archaeon ex4484_14]|nr:MAG: hypothetical protein B6U68_03555 [Candidatus Aenigmarchaeota archaeon ex4484_14]